MTPSSPSSHTATGVNVRAGVYDFALSGSHCLRVLHPIKQKALDEAQFQFESRLNGVPSIRHVVISTVQRVHELDLMMLGGRPQDFRWRDHWENYQGSEAKVLSSAFPAHAIITVSDNATVDDVAAYLQRLFESDRARYPRHRGWNAMGVHYKSAVRLDTNHPFYRYARTEKLGSDCCRFLVVNRMAAEGVDNKYLTVWGIAENLTSEVDTGQRLGRTLRSAAMRSGGQFLIPPASHDTVYLITHSTFGIRQGERLRKSNAQILTRAIYYLLHMEECTADLMTIDEYIALDSGTTSAPRLRQCKSISLAEKCDLVEAVAACIAAGTPEKLEALLEGGNVPLEHPADGETTSEDLISVINPGSSGELLYAYAQSLLRNTPVTYHLNIGGVAEPREIDAVTDIQESMLSPTPPPADIILEAEKLFVPKLNVATASTWLNDHAWASAVLNSRSVLGDTVWLVQVEKMRAEWDASYAILEFDFEETPADRVRFIVDQIMRRHRIPTKQELVAKMVLEGVRHRLGKVPLAGLHELEYGGPLCKSCVTYSLRNERFQDQLFKWVTHRLLLKGELPRLKSVLRKHR
jgi:hypothetical protein